MEEIIETNLKKMVNNGKGDMLSLLSLESLGGSAGYWKDYSCQGANFYYDRFNGEIKFFGNIQKVPKAIKQKFQLGTLRLAFDIRNSCKYRIIKYYLDEATKTAKSNLKKTIKIYNKEYGFQP